MIVPREAASGRLDYRRRRAGVHACAELFHQAEIVAVVPDLDDAAALEPEDVGTGEGDAAAGRLDARPRARVSAGGGPAPDDELVCAHEDLDVPPEVGEGRAKGCRDLLLPFGPGCRIPGAEVMADVVVREDLVGDVEVPFAPDLLVEPLDERLVLLGGHKRTL